MLKAKNINETKLMSLDFLQGSRMDETQGHAGAISASQTSAFRKIITYMLAAMVFLIPLIFLPFSTEVREFNKQAVLMYGTLVMIGAWVVRVLITRKISWIKTPLDYAVVAYVLLYFISSIFSIDRASSFLGYYGRFSGSFMSMLALGVLYFLVVNNVSSGRVIRLLIKSFVVSSGLVIIYSLLQVYKLYIFNGFTKATNFNPIGSMVSLSLFAALSVVVYVWILFIDPKLSRIKSWSLGLLTVLALFLMFILNATTAWIVLTIAMVVFIALGMTVMQSESSIGSFWKPMLVLVIAILFVAFAILPAQINPHRLVDRLNLPIEIQLSNKTSFNLVKNSLSSGAHDALIGSGPGTTGIAFGEIKPEVLNKTVVWSLNFDRASSEFTNLLIENGILGFVAFEAIAILFLIYSLHFLLRKDDQPKMYAFGFFMIWVVLYVSHFFYFFNTISYFFYWLAIALFMSLAHRMESREDSLSMNTSPRTALTWMFASLLLFAAVLVGVFFETTVYMAEAYYNSGVRNIASSNPDFNKVRDDLAQAVNLNQYRDIYQLGYSQDLYFLISIEAAKKDANIPQIQQWISDMIASAKSATNVSPNKASDWSALAQFYGSIKPFGVDNTDNAAIDAWKQAISHDSKNPVLHVQLAQAYVDAADQIDVSLFSQGTDTDKDGISDSVEAKVGSDPNKADSNGNGVDDSDELKAGFNPAGTGRIADSLLLPYIKTDSSKLKSAEDELTTAISLKQDLPDPYIALARVQEKEGKLDQAKKGLDQAASQFPYNADILFEQGRVTYNQGNMADASKIFNNVLKLSPNHANAIYSLALIDLKNNDKNAALDKLKKVREITGPNVDLDALINALENPTTK